MVLAGAVVAVVRSRGPEVHTAIAVRRDIEQHIVASGRVWVPTRVQVAAQSAGWVRTVAVREGDRVSRGELLVQLDDAEARAGVARAKAAVDQAKARLERLRRVGAVVATQELRQAQTNLDAAEDELARAAKLGASGTIPPAELDDARRTVERARAQRAAAEAQQLASAPKGAESRLALTSLLEAQAELAAADVRLSQSNIVALQDAVVLMRTVEPGDVVQPSRTLLVLAADGDETRLVFQSDERNLAAIRLGQQALASADAFPAEVFGAEVSHIAPSIDPERGTVEVRLLVADPPPFLLPDMTVSIDLTVATKRHVLTLPSDAVHGAISAAPWVFAIEHGRAVRKDVTLGIRGDGTVEIASELRDGAEVVISNGRSLASGQRVRVRRQEP